MRALRAALAAFLLLSPLSVWARTAIIYDRANAGATNGAAALRSEYQETANRTFAVVTGFINTYNPGSYDVWTSDVARTSLVKDGIVRGNTYSAVIWISTSGIGSATRSGVTAGCSPCSLTTVAMFPTVPQAMIYSYVETEGGPGIVSACSTNVVSNGFDPGGQGPDYYNQRVHVPGSTKGWPIQPGMSPSIFGFDNSSLTVAGGTYRVLLGSDAGNLAGDGSLGTAVRQPKPAWRDSFYTFGPGSLEFTQPAYLANATGPTMGTIVSVRYMDHVATGKPIIFATCGAHHNSVIGGGTTANVDNRIQVDPVPAYVAIAFLDSLTGGAVLGTHPEPIHAAVQISGGFRRGVATGAGGFAPFDSNTVKATCDSLRTLGIPFTVGANPDSIDAYASDVALWKRLGSVHFAIESWSAVADSSAGRAGTVLAASSSPTSPVIADPFGRFRSRTFYHPVSDTTDTSMAALLYRAKQVIARKTGQPVDGVVIPAQDDQSPRNWNSGGADSVAAALTAAGLTGVAQNADDSLSTLATGPKAGNRWAYSSNQRFIKDVAFLSFPGFNPRGSTYGNGRPIVGDGSLCDSSWCIAYTQRSLLGLFNGFWVQPQKYPWLVNNATAGMTPTLWWTEPGMQAEISPKSNIRTGVNLVRITASSLGSGESTASPNMPGYYTVKYLKYIADTINSYGRTLIVFGYPQDIGRRDIRR